MCFFLYRNIVILFAAVRPDLQAHYLLFVLMLTEINGAIRRVTVLKPLWHGPPDMADINCQGSTPNPIDSKFCHVRSQSTRAQTNRFSGLPGRQPVPSGFPLTLVKSSFLPGRTENLDASEISSLKGSSDHLHNILKIMIEDLRCLL